MMHRAKARNAMLLTRFGLDPEKWEERRPPERVKANCKCPT